MNTKSSQWSMTTIIFAFMLCGLIGGFAYSYYIHRNINSDAQKQILILVGPPGSGKGSVSQWFVDNSGWAQLSTGDLCRQHIANKTAIGTQIDEYIRAGKLIPDNIMISMVEEWMLDKFKNIDVLLLDGFPRTLAQAQALHELLQKDLFKNVSLSVVELVIADARVQERILSRLICSNKSCGAVYSTIDEKAKPNVAMTCDKCNCALAIRADDNAESLKQRLEIYHKNADELLGYYQNIGGYKTIKLDVDKPLDNVVADFKKAVTL